MAGNNISLKNKAYLYGTFFAIAAYAVVACGDALIKKAMEMHEMIYIAFYTNVATALFLVVIALGSGKFSALYKTHNIKLHILRAFLFLGVYLSFLYSISNMTIAMTYTLYLTQPFILVILAHFITKEYIGWPRVISIVVSFFGVLVVLRPGLIPLELPAITALLCALLFASGNILVKFMDSRDSWMSYVFYVIMIQTPILGAYLLLNGELTPSIPSTDSLPWIIGAGFFYTIALGLFPMAMQRIDAAVFGALEYTVLFWGTLFGFLLFSEVPDIWTIAGASIIVASGLFLVYRERRANHLVKELEGI